MLDTKDEELDFEEIDHFRIHRRRETNAWDICIHFDRSVCVEIARINIRQVISEFLTVMFDH